MSARLFLWRWTTRMVRRDWRQYSMIVVTLTLAVGLSVGGTVAAVNLVAPNPWGTANNSLTTDGDPAQLRDALAEQGFNFGEIESTSIFDPASRQRLALRVQDPNNQVTGPLVSLVDGRWPMADGEVAVTDRFGAGLAVVGDVIDLAGRQVTIVGVVENPADLSDEFALASGLDQFGLEPNARASEFLVEGNPDDSLIFEGGLSSAGVVASPRVAAAIVGNLVTVLGLLVVGLLASSGFAVIATRRSRDYGLVAAAGATPANLRFAATMTGVVTGTVGSGLGLLLGLGVAVAAVPTMEGAVGHRIDIVVPWRSVILQVVLAVLAASAAARWPARSVSKRPVVHLLASRRPRRAPTGRVGALGAVLAAGGPIALGVGFSRQDPLLAAVGLIGGFIGVLLLAPIFVQLVGRVAAKFPLAIRMAGRALVRHNRRAAAMAAAVAIALAIPAGIVVTTSSVDQVADGRGPNLPEGSLIAWLPGYHSQQAEVPLQEAHDGTDDAVAAVATAAPQLAVTPIEMLIASDSKSPSVLFEDIRTAGPGAYPAEAGRPGDPNCLSCNVLSIDSGDYVVDNAWIASPELLAAFGFDVSAADGSGSHSFAQETGIAVSDDYVLIAGDRVYADGIDVVEPWSEQAAVPPLLISPSFADNVGSGIERATVGWIATSTEPISAETRAAVVDAAGSTLQIEFRSVPEPQSRLRAVGLTIGTLVALALVASTVRLMNAELAPDRQVLAAIGAKPATVRLMSASIALLLAVTGGVLAVLLGYLALVPLLALEEPDFPFIIPFGGLAAVLVLFPLLAGALGSLGGGATSRSPTGAA